jgi:hypothetical protein
MKMPHLALTNQLPGRVAAMPHRQLSARRPRRVKFPTCCLRGHRSKRGGVGCAFGDEGVACTFGDGGVAATPPIGLESQFRCF